MSVAERHTSWSQNRKELAMSTESARAPKRWQGRYYEDFDVGDVFRSRFGRTVTEYDNLIFTCLTMNTNPLHFDQVYAERTSWRRILVNSTFTIALVTGLAVPDTSEHAAANLSWTNIKLPKPVFVGDTIWAESEILDKRESSSNPAVGIVTVRCRGINQRREVVCEFKRSFMIYLGTSEEAEPSFPDTEVEWTV